jgi:hypothetical protein
MTIRAVYRFSVITVCVLEAVAPSELPAQVPTFGCCQVVELALMSTSTYGSPYKDVSAT